MPRGVHVSRVLTDMSKAYIQANDEFVYPKVFPVLPVTQQSNQYRVYTKADWLRDEAKLRANATESAGKKHGYTAESYACVKYAFHEDVTEDDRANADNDLDIDRDTVEFVTRKIMIANERRFAAAFFKAGVWGTDITGVASDSPSSGQFERFDRAGSDPLGVVSTQRSTIKGLTGFAPNTIVVGSAVHAALKNHADVVDRVKYTQRGVITADILAALFEVDKYMVAEAVYDSAAEGATESPGFIFGTDGLLLAYATPRPGIKQPTAGTTFAWTGLPGADRSTGIRAQRFDMPQLDGERIEAEAALDMKVVGADLGAYFATAVS